MNEPLIELYAYHKSGKFFADLLGKAICFFTGSSFVHAALYFNGAMWESGVWTEGKKLFHGAKMTTGQRRGDMELRMKRALTNLENEKLTIWLVSQVRERMPYNFLKLLVLMIVYPTRWLWKWLKYVPFQADFWGEVCSEFVDKAFKEGAGIDLLPNRLEDYTVPGDFLASPLLDYEVIT